MIIMISRNTTKEIRIEINNIKKFRKKLTELNAIKVYSYRFTDFIFAPRGKKYNLNKESMKLRKIQIENKTVFKLIYQLVKMENEIKVLKNGFKQNLESLDKGFELLERWNFKKLFSFKRTGEKYSINKFSFVLEKFPRIGWLIEIDGTISEIKKTKKILGLKRTINKTIPFLIEKSLK